jgi:hypothetical protein
LAPHFSPEDAGDMFLQLSFEELCGAISQKTALFNNGFGFCRLSFNSMRSVVPPQEVTGRN